MLGFTDVFLSPLPWLKHNTSFMMCGDRKWFGKIKCVKVESLSLFNGCKLLWGRHKPINPCWGFWALLGSDPRGIRASFANH